MTQINQYKHTQRIIFFLFFISFSFPTIAQNKSDLITIQQKKITLEEVFSRIEQQTNYSIAYERSHIDLNKIISVSIKDAKIEDAMEQILQTTGYSYKINGYHIIISVPNTNTSIPQKNSGLKQTIRGTVKDGSSGAPLPYVTVTVSDIPGVGTTTDEKGRFILPNIPIGRHTVTSSFIGYATHIANEILLTSSKEVFLEISLQENAHELQEVVVRPQIKKEELLNAMALTGGRMISMEEASRFASGFDDPARLVTAFAGVAGDVGSNAVAIRGNSPQFTQWKMEGVEIPNPTHFADIMGLGGGLFSGLSTQVVGNSDFYNGAFPAEYNNALSGVFDVHMRTGNSQKHEHTFQVSLLGFDVASEGPISKKQGSSYLFNTRISTTTLATGGEYDMNYQDLSFKLNFPTNKVGVFSIWGLGLIDSYRVDAKKDQSEWETLNDRTDSKNNLEKLTGGLTHKYFFNNNTYIRSSLSGLYTRDKTTGNQYTLAGEIIPIGDVQNRKWDISFNSYVNKKFSSKHTNRTGVTITHLNYDLDYKVSPDFGLDAPMEQIAKGKGTNRAFSAFSSSVIDLNEYLKASIGVNVSYFDLNRNWSVEPRASVKWSPVSAHSFSASYGLHSRRERLDYYYITQEVGGKTETNKYLDLAKAHHFGLGYDWNISPIHHLRIEPYYQYLYDLPVEENSSFSIINYEGFYLDRILKNKGIGNNYGIDITFEQYMKNGFYYMVTGSVFKSRYKAGDNTWRNTRMDRRFMINALAGKEWMVGKQKQNMFSLNVHLFFRGGDRYTPLDKEQTLEKKDIVFDETKAYSLKYRPVFNGNISVNYRVNKRRLSHEFSLKLLNAGLDTGVHYFVYQEKTQTIKKEKGLGFIPNISYKITF